MYNIRTTIKVGGREFEFSFDNDTNKEQLDRALSQMEYLAKTLPEEQPSKTLPEQPAEPNQGDVQSFNCNKVVVTGTLKEPRVEMYSSNPSLKFPIVKCPIAIFERCYYGADNMEDLNVVGNVLEVDWTVYWKRSEKDPKYKDLYKVVSNG
jgi:hypothetical protein